MANRKLQLVMKFVIFFISGLLTYNSLSSQVVTDDTVVCIIDTTNSYVEFVKNPIKRDNYQPPDHWQIRIDGHYYDHVPYDKDIACIVFSAGWWSGNLGNISGFPKKRVPKKGLTERFIVVDDEWINQQTSLNSLGRKLGYAPFSKYNYIIFSQDYDCSDSDSVTMHRVEIGYSEVQY
jgi:hypothetical protein